jgi:NADH dehydrogenase (ubiquinone) Fe-S protein 3
MNTELTQNLGKTLPKWIDFYTQRKNHSCVYYVNKDFIIPFFYFLKNHMNTKCHVLVDITAVDYPSRTLRFEVVYHLLSIFYNFRLRVKVCVDEITPVHSITSLYPGAGWFERECWDMFGIFFLNHPDLRRILSDYGFTGHPLRKDFPLSGFTEVVYDDSEKRVITEPLQLTQNFRYFDFSSPWDQNPMK